MKAMRNERRREREERIIIESMIGIKNEKTEMEREEKKSLRKEETTTTDSSN
jgi:hypothetical protein